MWLLLFACTSPDKNPSPDTGDPLDTGEADDTGIDDAPWFCSDTLPAVTAGSHTDWAVSTAHYQLEVDGSEAWANQLGLMAEAAWLAYGDWFEAEPASTPLRAGFYGSSAALQAAMERDGVSPSSAAGYYSWNSATAYTSDQPTEYYDQVLFLHELAHQWHHQAVQVDGNQSSWYVEGVAELVSRHDWDGECLRVARLPILSQEDMPAQALSAVDSYGADVDGWIGSDSFPSLRPLGFAVLRWLMETDPQAFQAFRSAYDADGSSDPGDLLGPLDSAAFEAWLRGAQLPMTPTWLEWTHRTPDSVRGWSEVHSVAQVKVPGERFAATLQVPDVPFWAGLVLGWDSGSEHTVLYVDQDGGLILGEVLGGGLTFWDAGAIPAPSGTLEMSVTWEAERPVVQLGSDTVQPTVVHAPGAGLTIYGADVVFTDMEW